MTYEISDDQARVDLDAVHRWIAEESYWALGRSRAAMERAIAGSVCIGAYAPDGSQVGFARVVSDGATFAWLCDVFVDAAHRGGDLGKRLVEAALAHPGLEAVPRWLLATADAHGLYRRYGFDDADAERYMVLHRAVQDHALRS